MADVVEVAVLGALQAKLKALTFSPALSVSWPDLEFTPPAPEPGSGYLRATFMPVPTIPLGVGFGSSNQHYGLFQVDVFHVYGGGEMNSSRVAGTVINHFKRGTRLQRDGFIVQIDHQPYRGRALRDDPWTIIPVSIPYMCFAPTPA